MMMKVQQILKLLELDFVDQDMKVKLNIELFFKLSLQTSMEHQYVLLLPPFVHPVPFLLTIF